MKLDCLKTAFYKGVFQLKKHSPEILAVTGVVGIAASFVMACIATTKADAVLEQHNEEMDAVHLCAEDETLREEYTALDKKKDTVAVYTKTGFRFVRLYAPSVAVCVLSVGCLLTSNHILKSRAMALAAAYATLDKSYKGYRQRVAERFGEEVERELRYDVKALEVAEEGTDENGMPTVEQKTVSAVGIDGFSEYARFFDETCPDWEKNPDYNLTFLKAQQSYANNILASRGYLFLNEVYDMLGIPRTIAGQVVGWRKDAANGDGFVDFGIFNTMREANREFVNGYERSILLDFNVDGDILHTDMLETI